MKRIFFLTNLILTALVAFLGVRIFYTLASAGFQRAAPRGFAGAPGKGGKGKTAPNP